MWDTRIAKKFTSAADIKYYAKKRTPKSIYNAFAPSAESGPDVDLNVQALRDIQVKPHEPVSVAVDDISTTVVGHKIDLPVILSSVGGLRGAHRDGELAIARAAGEAGTIYYVSGMTTTPIEEIMKIATGPVFQQIYYIGSRDAAKELVDRAINAGVSGLVLIADWPAFPEPFSTTPADRGFLPTVVSAKDAVKFMPQLVTRPAWAIDFVLNGVNAPKAQYSKGPDGKPLPYYHATQLLAQETPDLSDIEWIREKWKGPLILKGLMRADDAAAAADAGVDGIVVSNHVSGQPGRRIPTIRALPEIVEAVGDRVDVLFDGGIRAGSDVVKAMAVGAKAVGIGQLQVNALMAAGEPGVKAMMGVLHFQIIQALRQFGVRTPEEIDPTALVFPGSWADQIDLQQLREQIRLHANAER